MFASRLSPLDPPLRLLRVGLTCAVVLLSLMITSPEPFKCSPVTGVLTGFSVTDISGVQVYFKKGEGHLAGIGAVMHAGTGDQLTDEAHCAHMAEHMVLMYPTSSGESLWDLATAGWEPGTLPNLGGHTSLDSTELGFAVPLDDLDKALTMLIESLFNNRVIASAAFDEEIARSRSELTYMTTGDVGAPLNRLRLNLLRGTPYDERMFETDLSEVTPEKIRGFMEREYSPERLILVVIADRDEDAVLKTVRNCLGGVESGKEPILRSVQLSPPERDWIRLAVVDQPKVLVGLTFGGVAPEDYTDIYPLLSTIFLNRTKTPVAGLIADPQIMLIDLSRSVSSLIFTYTAGRSATESDLVELADEAVASLHKCIRSFITIGPSESDLAQGPSQVDPNIQRAIGALPEVYSELQQFISILTPGRVSPADLASGTSLDTPPDIKSRIRGAASKYLPSAKVSSLLVTGESFSSAATGRPQWQYLVGLAFPVGAAIWWFVKRRNVSTQDADDGLGGNNPA